MRCVKIREALADAYMKAKRIWVQRMRWKLRRIWWGDSFSFTLDPTGAKSLKPYSSYRFQQKFSTFPELSSWWSSQNCLGVFETVFPIFSVFVFEVWHSPLYHMEKPKIQLPGQTSDDRVRRSEILDAGVGLGGMHLWYNFDLVVFNVILGSFCAFAIFQRLLLLHLWFFLGRTFYVYVNYLCSSWNVEQEVQRPWRPG